MYLPKYLLRWITRYELILYIHAPLAIALSMYIQTEGEIEEGRDRKWEAKSGLLVYMSNSLTSAH